MLKIFFVGEEGAGKSSLINALIGREIAKEGAGADPVTGLEALRNPYRNVYVCAAETNVEVEAWDSPGFRDLNEGGAAVYQQQMQHILRQVHLVIYCITSGRLDGSTLAVLKKFIECEPNVISRMIVAITKVNLMMVPETCEAGGESDFFEQEVEKIKYRICKLLNDIHIPHDVINGIPFVQTGYYRHTRITPNPQYLHDRCIDWLLIFWFRCLVRCDDAWPALLLLSNDRLCQRRRGDNSSLELVQQDRNSQNGQLNYGSLHDVMDRVPSDQDNKAMLEKLITVCMTWIKWFLDMLHRPMTLTKQ